MTQKATKPFNYAIGMFGTSIPINMLKTFAFTYYVLGLGVTTTQWAAMLLIYTFIDALDNPIYGFLSDRTRSRWGRRRPWLAIGTPLLILGFIAFYNMPAFLAGNSIFAYAMLFYILTGTLDSVINANYGALFPELFRGDAVRAKTNAMRQAFQLVAMIISIALTPMVTEALGYGLTSILYGILGGAVILYMTFTCREREPEPEEAKPGLWKALKDLLTNRKFWIAGFANAFYSAAMSLVLASVAFYVEYALGLSAGQSTFLLAAVLVIAIACVAVWAWLVRKFTLIPVWRAALAVLAVTFIPLYFANPTGDGDHLLGIRGLWLCRCDHHHGPDRRQDHGRGHPETRSAAGRHHLQRAGIHEPAEWPVHQRCLPAGVQALRLREWRQSRPAPG